MQNLVFRQLFERETSTYTYLIGDPKTKEALIIDPVLETVERDLQVIKELGLKLTYVLDTHIHADHITAAGELRTKTGAKTAVGSGAGVNCADILLEDGEQIKVGDLTVTALATPGHTDSCMTYHVDSMIFTGDSLMIRAAGRTDFQQGSSAILYQSITQKLFTLPPETVVYPGHDYRGNTSSTIAEEMKWNPRIRQGVSQADFEKTMAELKLSLPAKIHEAVPANLACGAKKRVLSLVSQQGTPEVTVDEVFKNLGKIKLIDVRRPDEFTGELGHIEGSILSTMGDELNSFLRTQSKTDEIVFVCRSGNRSGHVTEMALSLGFSKVANMIGGMIAWNEERYPLA